VKPVLFHPEAQREFFAAQDFYEQRVLGLGHDFKQEVVAGIGTIQLAPHRWPVGGSGTRSYLVHRFPFRVVYFELPDTIWVVAVAHASRRPGYWRTRVRRQA